MTHTEANKLDRGRLIKKINELEEKNARLLAHLNTLSAKVRAAYHAADYAGV